MTRKQKAVIASIIIAPVIIGVIIFSFENKSSSILAAAQNKKVGLVRITDIIYDSDYYVWQLRELRQDNSVGGVLLRLESPGGAVSPSQEIYGEVMRYRSENKPLIVSMGNVAASGAYYLASPAQKIFANPGTLTGSIGVILRFPQYFELMEKIGVKFQTIKAGAFKDIGSPNREMSDQERAFLQDLIDDTHDQFIRDVSAARAMNIDTVRMYADGRIFTGRQAKAFGLVDSLGGYEDALAFLRALVGVSDKAKIVEKKKGQSVWREMLTEGVLGQIPFFRSAHRPGGAYFLLENY